MSGQTFDDSGVDRSIGLLILGMVVIGFLLLMILGMNGVDRTAKSMTDEHPKAAPTPVLDFTN